MKHNNSKSPNFEKADKIDKIFDSISDFSIEFFTKTIGRKWALNIIFELEKNGKMRNKDIDNKLSGISPSNLSSLLKHLQQEGFIRREVFGEIPPYQVEYSLTQKGKQFLHLLAPFLKWLTGFEKPRCYACYCTREDCEKSGSSCECVNCVIEQCCCWQIARKATTNFST